jgi:hypothetical protein
LNWLLLNADTLPMNLIISLLSGFITALMGITPPGLLNMTAAKVNKEGKEMLSGLYLGQ